MNAASEREGIIAAMLMAYEARLRRLTEEIDAGWLAAAGLDVARQRLGCGRHLPEALGLHPAATEDFAPPLHRISLLPRPASARLLRLRALWRRRGLVRSPDKRLQRGFRAWLGDLAYETLLREGGEGDGDVGLPLAPGGASGMARALAWEGYCLFERDGAWRTVLPARLLRLGFAPNESGTACTGAADPLASHWIVERLPRLVPEVSWVRD